SFEEAFKSMGGTITISAAHEDEKADYSAEVAALAAAGGDRLVVAGYNTGGGAGIIRASLDSGAFDMFHLPDGMIGGSLETDFGSEIDGTTGQAPGTDSPGASQLVDLIGDAFDGSSVFVAESYDAAALIMLAMQAAGSDNPADYKGKVMDVANAPGEKIYPGELAKGLEILANGGDIDYVGASAVELIGPGESSGSYRQIVFEGGKMTTVKYR
ncbi:MAG: branched-chain amino acid ABC transporter substrate-binding protein, partial [Rhodobacteraceae bacterium]|nr:branched-chain amino acid ABC transporter substrate-binding protein [Paracoccaceae bacterium]